MEMYIQAIIGGLFSSASALGMWLHTSREMTNVQAASWLSIFGLIRGVISLAGIICLVYAFWVKFKRGEPQTGKAGPAVKGVGDYNGR